MNIYVDQSDVQYFDSETYVCLQVCVFSTRIWMLVRKLKSYQAEKSHNLALTS